MSTQIIRCPICLLSQPIKTDVSPDKALHCGNCQRNFAVKNGLPLNEGGAISYATESTPTATAAKHSSTIIESATPRNVVITWIVGALFGLIVIDTSRSYMAPLRGPEFLAFYFMLFTGLWLLLAAMRKYWEDSSHVTFISLFIFEGVGLLRYLDASAAGMHKFVILFIMMGIGGILFFVRGEFSDYGSDDSHSSCGSTSGGGGGCGGCGD